MALSLWWDGRLGYQATQSIERRKPPLVQHTIKANGLSERHDCRLLNNGRTGFRYQPKRPIDGPILHCLRNLAKRHRRWGFDKMMWWLHRRRYPWNHKTVYRVYCDLWLKLRVKAKKRLNRTYRENVLDIYLFRDLREDREITAQWIAMYNTERSHAA